MSRLSHLSQNMIIDTTLKDLSNYQYKVQKINDFRLLVKMPTPKMFTFLSKKGVLFSWSVTILTALIYGYIYNNQAKFTYNFMVSF